jgi:phosphatidate cytidylyltransferase
MTSEESSLRNRLVVSAVLVSATLYTIFLAPAWLFILVVEVFLLAGLNEFLTLAEKKGLVINRGLGLFFGSLFPLAYFLPSESLIFVIASLSIFIFNFHRRLREQALVNTAVTVFGLLYVAWFLSFLVKLRFLPNGAEWVLYTVLIVKLGDAAAYFYGRAFGRVKLIEHISPKKSVEGAIAGFAVTVAASLASKLYLPHVAWLHLIAMGIVVAFLAELGDLAESLIKRDVGVKDSGELPGLGGVLDILDSLLLSVPFIYYYVTTFPGID